MTIGVKEARAVQRARPPPATRPRRCSGGRLEAVRASSQWDGACWRCEREAKGSPRLLAMVHDVAVDVQGGVVQNHLLGLVLMPSKKFLLREGVQDIHIGDADFCLAMSSCSSSSSSMRVACFTNTRPCLLQQTAGSLKVLRTLCALCSSILRRPHTRTYFFSSSLFPAS